MKSSTHKKTVLITAGPTREAIDPVRYISNHSSGKMGYTIAEAFLVQGFHVILVSGPVNRRLQHPNLTLVNVTSAQEMFVACQQYFSLVDAAVFAAAVADYRPEEVAAQKIKKDDDVFTIRMVKNPDGAYEFGKVKTDRQVSVGFALETVDEEKHAVGKLLKKNFDFVVLNSTNDAQATFGYDTNKVTVFHSDFTQTAYPLLPKSEVAAIIVYHTQAALTKTKEAVLVR